MKKNKLLKGLVCILGLFILTACSAQSNIESEQTEVDYAGEESIEKAMENDTEENEMGEKEEVTENEEEIVERMTSREALELMFDYLYPDKSNMAKVVFLDMGGELSYTFYYMESNLSTHEEELSDPTKLYLSGTTEDGLYYQFALYEEIWDTIRREDGDYKEFSHLSFFNHWYVNAETKEIIPRKIFNEEAEEDEVYLIFNEKFDEISRKYSAYEEE